MKVLHIANFGGDNLTNITGIGAVVSQLAKCQILLGHNVKVGIIIPNKKYLYQDGYYLIDSIMRFFNLINSFSPNIIIFHSLYNVRYLQFGKVLRKYGIPYLIEFHGGATIQNANKGRLKKKIANYLGFFNFVKKAKGLIYLNQQEQHLSVMHAINPNYCIIPNGIDIPKCNVLDKTVRDKVEFVFLGRIDMVHKGLDILLDALRILCDEGWHSYVHFSFYGAPDNPGDFFDRVNALTDIASFEGPIFGSNKIKMLCDKHIYILTSRYEGMPLTVLEALSCGCPCLITSQTNMEDLIVQHQCGWITPLSSISIAREIKRSCTEYQLNKRKLIRNSMNAVRGYEWDKIAKDSINCYERYVECAN